MFFYLVKLPACDSWFSSEMHVINTNEQHILNNTNKVHKKSLSLIQDLNVRKQPIADYNSAKK